MNSIIFIIGIQGESGFKFYVRFLKIIFSKIHCPKFIAQHWPSAGAVHRL